MSKELIDKICDALDALENTERVELWNEYLCDNDRDSEAVQEVEDVNEEMPGQFGDISNIIRMFSEVFEKNGKPACEYFRYDEERKAIPFCPATDIDDEAIAEYIIREYAGSDKIKYLPEEIRKCLRDEKGK